MLTSCMCTMETHRFSGSSRPGPSVSSSNQLHVRFTSNGSSQHYGFKATYRGMSSFLSWSCSRKKGFSGRWDFFFTEVNPCWTRLITRWMTLQDCRPRALWRQAGVYAFVCLTNFQVWSVHLFCASDQTPSNCHASSSPGRPGDQIQLLRWSFSLVFWLTTCCRLIGSNPTQRISFSAKTHWNILH